MEDKKNSRIGFITKSQYNPAELTGTIYWGEDTYKVKNITNNGSEFIGDVMKKDGTKYLAKNGVEYDHYEVIGAVRWNTESGTGSFVTELAGQVVKYDFTTDIQNKNGTQSRVFHFKQASTNKFRGMFEQAMTVVAEEPSTPEEQVQAADIPDLPL